MKRFKQYTNLKKLLGIASILTLLLGTGVLYTIYKQMPVSAESQAEDVQQGESSDEEEGEEEEQDEELSEALDEIEGEDEDVKETPDGAQKDVKSESQKMTTEEKDEGKPISELFPDPVLAEVIANQLNKPNINAIVAQTELNKITTIKYGAAMKKSIKRLIGLELLQNVRSINLEWNEISDVTPLQNLTQLQELWLNMNQIKNIDMLGKLTNINTLAVRYNKIKDLGVLSRLTNLRKLEIGVNQITDISVLRHLTQLEVLKLERNKVRDIAPLGNLTNLRVLKLFGNEISDIWPLASLQNLQELDLGKRDGMQTDNDITDFSVLTTLPQLDKLLVAGQGIAKINPQVLRQVGELDVSRSNLTDLQVFVNLSHLRKLWLGNNAFEDVNAFAYASMPNLNELDLSVNHIIDLTPFKSANLPALKKLLLDGQRYKEVPRVPHAEEVVMENKTRDVDGMLVEPSRLIPASKTTYESPYMFLRMKMVQEGYQIGYQWDKVVTIGQASTHYTGKNEAYVYEHYPVNFIVDEAVYASLTEVIPNSTFDEPTLQPTKEGYDFVGWFTQPVGGEVWDFAAGKTPREPLTLYAQFLGIPHVVTYDNEGVILTQTEVRFGDKLVEQIVPSKQGYTFKGWYTTPIGDEQWEFATRTMPNTDLTLYAQYTQNVYDVIFDNEGIQSEPVAVNFGETFAEPEKPSKVGYTFVGWYQEDGMAWEFATDTMPDYNMTLYARYTRNTHFLVYNDDGTLSDAITVNFDDLLPQPEKPSKVGYTFVGWYQEDNMKWDFATNKMPDNNLTLYAKYVPNVHLLLFNDEGTVSKPVKVEFGAVLPEPATPTKRGYAFVGWYTDEGATWDFAMETMPDNDVTLYAKYVGLPHTVTYEYSNGSPEVVIETTTGSMLEEPEKPEKVGYTFVSWSREDGTVWDFASDVLADEDIVLTAQYTGLPHTVTYEYDNDEPDLVIKSATGEMLEQPENPMRRGYNFIGWFTTREGNSTWDFAKDTMPDNDIILYARWQETARKLFARAKPIELDKTKFMTVKAQKKLEQTLVDYSDVQVIDENEEVLYDKTNAIFTVTNIKELVDVLDAGEYSVRFAYVSPLYADDVSLSTTVKLTVLPETVVNPNGSGSNNNGLPQTGAYTNEHLLFSFVLMVNSLILLGIVYLRKKRDRIEFMFDESANK